MPNCRICGQYQHPSDATEHRCFPTELNQLRAELAAAREEIARLKTVPMKYRRMAFNAKLQRQVEAAESRVAELEKDRNELKEKLDHNRKAFINHIYISNDEFGRICEERSNAIDSSQVGFGAIRDAIRLLDNDATSFHNRVRTALRVLRKVCPDV